MTSTHFNTQPQLHPPQFKPHPISVQAHPVLPPTPPASAHSSPPQTLQLQTSLSPSFDRLHPPQLPSLNDLGPARRHQYEMPPTPGISHLPQFPQTFPSEPISYDHHSVHLSPSSLPTDYHHHHHHHPSSPQSHWHGTLSASLANSLNRFRHSLFNSDNISSSYSPISTHSDTFPFASQARSFISLSSRRIVNDTLQNLSPSSLRFGLLCSLWYTTSALSSNTGKAILTRFRYPVTLTTVQLGFMTIWCALFIAIREGLVAKRFSGIKSRSAGGFWGIKRPNKATVHGTLIMSLFSISGHVCGSMAMARVPVSTVHTIKALSPLFTVIAYAGLFGVRYGPMTYFSLLPLTLGVMLACSFDLRANGVGFLCALGSTIIFVSQNIYGKKLLPHENDDNKLSGTKSSNSGKMDKLNLLFYSSAMGFLLMVPIWIWIDFTTQLKLWFNPIYDPRSSVATQRTSGLMFYFFCNGTVHFAQCIIALSVLSRTSPVTYSIASLIKRIAVICIAIVWFGQPVSGLQAFGMLLTFTGLYIYNQAKSSVDIGERRRGQLERKNDILLPRTQLDLTTDDHFSTVHRRPSPILDGLSAPKTQTSYSTHSPTAFHRALHPSPPTYSPEKGSTGRFRSTSVSATSPTHGLPSMVLKPVPVQ